jgi:hypothetical protein
MIHCPLEMLEVLIAPSTGAIWPPTCSKPAAWIDIQFKGLHSISSSPIDCTRLNTRAWLEAPMALKFLYSAFLLILLTSALPIPPMLAADSLSVFTDPNSHYPRLHDALHSLCRNVADLHRAYELDTIYRTSELRQAVVGNRLDAVCGMTT